MVRVGSKGRFSRTGWRRKRARLFVLAALAAVLQGAAPGVAQDEVDKAIQENLPPGTKLPAGLENALRERREGQARPLPTNEVIPVRRPRGAEAAQLKPSLVESLFSERAGAELSLFGHDFFGARDSVAVRQQGAVQDDYVMGPGDRLVVDLRGQENATYRVSVDREGRVFVNHLKPIAAAGRNFRAFREELENRVKQAYIATEVFVSLENIRQASVLVSGEVAAPGVQVVSSLSSVLDALVLAGGVKKTGSLRNIVIQRNGETVEVDLYGVLSATGPAPELTLRDGDRIIVPPLGKTVAISGAVQRPAIYELPPSRDAVKAEELVALAGGVSARGAYRLTVERIRQDGYRYFDKLDSLAKGLIGDSEILFVNPSVDRSLGQVVLAGHIRGGGKFALGQQRTLKSLLPSRDVFDRSPYLLFGLVSRRDPDSLLRKIIPFSPLQVVSGAADIALEDDDIVRVFSVNEVRALGMAVNQNETLERREKERSLDRGSRGLEEFEGAAEPSEASSVKAASAGAAAQGMTGAPADDEVSRIVSGSIAASGGEGALLDSVRGQGAAAADRAPYRTDLGAPSGPGEGRPAQAPLSGGGAAVDFTRAADALARELLVEPAMISRLLANYRVNILGAVRMPGYYFVLRDTSLAELVEAAGGTDYRVDLGSVEITATEIRNATGEARTVRRTVSLTETPMEALRVRPLDTVRFRQVFSDLDEGTVAVRGQVRSEGAYDILRGETLSSVIERAGGLTDIAYPYGTVFIRKSAARDERRSNLRTATEIETQLLTMRKNVNLNPTQIALVKDILGRLRDEEGLGRISVEADPVVLAARPELDVVLEPGDVVYFPRRPTTVAVSGMVLNPGSYQFRPRQDASDYIEMAGGLSQFADRGRMFVIFPDGTSRPLAGSFWSTKSFEIPPGSVIVVPRDLTPFDLGQFTIDFMQVMGQLAVTAASVSVIGR